MSCINRSLSVEYLKSNKREPNVSDNIYFLLEMATVDSYIKKKISSKNLKF